MNPQGTYGKSAEKLNKRTFEKSCVDIDKRKLAQKLGMYLVKSVNMFGKSWNESIDCTFL